MESVQLLAIRYGDFVLRQDWGDRGGALLKPLGELIYTFPKENNKWFAEIVVTPELGSLAVKNVALIKKWLATEISENRAWVEYVLFEEAFEEKDSRRLAIVRENFTFMELEEKAQSYVRRNINIEFLVKDINLNLDKKYSGEKSFHFDYSVNPLKDY